MKRTKKKKGHYGPAGDSWRAGDRLPRFGLTLPWQCGNVRLVVPWSGGLRQVGLKLIGSRSIELGLTGQKLSQALSQVLKWRLGCQGTTELLESEGTI